jgi:LPXTG-motif cell wall-anchored protein
MKRRILAVVSALGVLLTLLFIGTNSAAAGVPSVKVTDLAPQGWDFSQSRTAGHHEFQGGAAAGLHIWTDDNSSQAKVAGYVGLSSPVSMPLVAAWPTDPSLDYLAAPGTIAPGYQMVVDAKDKNGVDRTFILVGEPVYGGKWWAASCSTWCADLGMEATGGGGSPYQGTLDEWATLLPKSSVKAVGFSLGSGVKGEGLLRSLTFMKITWSFCKGTPPTTTTTVPTSTTTTTAPSTSTSTSTSVSQPTSTTSGSVTTTPVMYEDCDAVIAAGKAPLYADKPGYRLALDRDRDGIACEREELSGGVSNVSNTGGGLASTGASNIALFITLGALLLLGGGAAVLIGYRRKSAR